VGLGTVSEYLARATAAGVRWPLPDDLGDAALEARLSARPVDLARRDQALPDWIQLHHELKRPGVTLQLVWLEYRAVHPTGYAYSHFCERYRRWARTLTPSMRQVHRAGDKLFVDFSGNRPSLVGATTGELMLVEFFVGVLGASGLIYAEATRSQELPAWVTAIAASGARARCATEVECSLNRTRRQVVTRFGGLLAFGALNAIAGGCYGLSGAEGVPTGVDSRSAPTPRP